MIRKLFWLIVAAAVGYGLDRLFRRTTPRAPTGRSPATPRFEGAMVRDRICQTFLPRSRALSLREGAVEHFFCSAACRDTFLTRSRAHSA